MKKTALNHRAISPNRSLLARTILAIALLQAGVLSVVSSPVYAADVPAGKIDVITPGSNVSFGPLKHVKAGLLDVAYAEVGPADGPVVILLHGWPYDIHSYTDVAPALAQKGYRVLIPYARGYGDTRFLSAKTIRMASPPRWRVT